MKEILLTKGKIALVDDADYPWLSNKKWSAIQVGSRWYAKRNRSRSSRKPRAILMHREVLDPNDGFDVDHKDFDGLNNRKENLRVCSRSQNMFNVRIRSNNSSGFKGVSWIEKRKRWESKLRYKGRTIHLGRFRTAQDAARAYDDAAIKLNGEFSTTNQKLGLL